MPLRALGTQLQHRESWSSEQVPRPPSSHPMPRKGRQKLYLTSSARHAPEERRCFCLPALCFAPGRSHCGLQMRRQALGYSSTCVLKAWNRPSRDCCPSSPGGWEARDGPRGLDVGMGCRLSTGQNCLAFTRNQPLTLASLPGAQN